MDKQESAIHHDVYEFAVNTISKVQGSEDTSPHVILNKDSILQLAACYMHLYNDLYINKRIEPFASFIKKVRIH